MEFKNLDDYWEKSSFSTKTLESAGKTPAWNETFDFYLKLDDQHLTKTSGVVFKVVDEDIK
jgi:hypothetical protein